MRRLDTCGPPDYGWFHGQHLTHVIRQPHDLVVLGRADDRIWFQQYTGISSPLSVGALPNHFWAVMGGQTTATVQGNTIWVGAAQSSPGAQCQVAVADTSHWSITGWTELDQICPGQPRTAAVATGDLDGDGDDEIVVTTPIYQSVDTSVVEISYGGSSGSERLNLVPKQKVRRWLGESTDPKQVDVAIGDLDGDGHQNEVVVAYNTTPDVNSPGTIGMYVYRYQDGGLQFQGTVQSFTPWTGGDKPPASVWDFEIATGRVRPTADDHEQIVLAVEVAVPRTKSFGRKVFDLSWNAYLYEWAADARGDRSLVEVEQEYGLGPGEFKTEVADLLGPYSISLATGDLDGDGMEEVIYSHPFRLYTSAGEGCLDCLPGYSLLRVGVVFVPWLSATSTATAGQRSFASPISRRAPWMSSTGPMSRTRSPVNSVKYSPALTCT